MSDTIHFKPLEKEDFPLLHKWLNEPHVKRWYGKYRDYSKQETVSAKYIRYINGEKPIQSYIICLGELPIGYLQNYRISDHPEYNGLLELNEETSSIDIYIGDRNHVYKGLGSTILKTFLKDYVWTRDDIDSCIIGPEPANTYAIRAYEKAGFRYLKTIQLPGESDQEYIMRVTPPNL